MKCTSSTKSITKNSVLKWQKSYKATKKLEEKILDRIDHVLHTIFKVFDVKLKYWYFDGAGEGEVGNLFAYLGDEYVTGLHIEAAKYIDMVILNKYGEEISLGGDFPTRWLFDNNFEKEIIKGKAAYLKRSGERVNYER